MVEKLTRRAQTVDKQEDEISESELEKKLKMLEVGV